MTTRIFPKLPDTRSNVAAGAITVACIVILVMRWSPHYSLAVGLLIGLVLGNPLQSITKPLTKRLLQASVVGLGFGMDFMQVARAGQEGLYFTIATIAGALFLGLLFGKLLHVRKRISFLISAGTAICGGSAIAAVSPVVEADEHEISVALATVFALNAIALFIFPTIGHAVGLNQQQFGLWCAIAIHDTSSVVGAAAAFGNEALITATTIKLARALWIVPLVIVTAMVYGKRAGMKSFPLFIVFFIAASLLKTYLPIDAAVSDVIVGIAKSGLSLTLFLIGIGVTMRSLKQVGFNALAQGVIVWVVLLTVTLVVIMN